MMSLENSIPDNQTAQYQDWLRKHPASSPYLQPAYLDTVAAGWKLLQLAEFLFPVVSRKLLWLRLMEQPLLTQHFALIGQQKPNNEAYTQLLRQLSEQFHHIDLCLDATNIPLPAAWKSEERITYRIAIPENPELLHAHYSPNLRRLVKKPTTLRLSKSVAIVEFMSFLKQHLSEKVALPASFYTRAAALLQHPHLKWEICGAYVGDKLVAGCAILYHGNQRYYQLAANAAEGKKLNAMHHLLDYLLTNWCGQDLVFDFEGSMIVGLQRFYSGFGAKPYIYTRVSYSRLPWPLSLWKHGIRSK